MKARGAFVSGPHAGLKGELGRRRANSQQAQVLVSINVINFFFCKGTDKISNRIIEPSCKDIDKMTNRDSLLIRLIS